MQQETGHSTFGEASRGLATVALLKTNFDNGHNHLGMFQPFLLDAISSLAKDDFQVDEIRDAMSSRHGLVVPSQTLRTLLRRTSKSGLVRRECGRYFRKQDFPQSDLREATAQIQSEHSRIARALRDYLAAHHQSPATDEEALALLLKFLERNHVGMVLDGPYQVQPDSAESLSDGKSRLVVRFITEIVPSNNHLATILQRMVEGFILQNTLLLKDISTANRKFKDLRVFLDTRLVLQALGYQGETSLVATSDVITMLKQAGARVEVLESTIREIKTLLQVYQERLGTSQGGIHSNLPHSLASSSSTDTHQLTWPKLLHS